jgi:predicted RNase H-like nuclease
VTRVLGIDACKAGWVGVLRTDGKVTAFVASTIEQLVKQAEHSGSATAGGDSASATAGGDRLGDDFGSEPPEPLDVVAIDMPIGLPDTAPRKADLLARAAIGRLSSSVFTTPVRAALQAPTHSEAVLINRELTGQGLSIQAYGLRAKLFEVDEWIGRATTRVVEVHPEVSFAYLAGAPLTVRKSTWAGAERRRALLAAAGIPLAGELGLAGLAVGVDDVLDAGAAAWSALRVAQGQAVSLPNPPETFTDGRPAAIWV